MKARPSKGQGNRFLECRLYDECLDVAGLRSWKAWSCEECDLYKSIFGKKASKNELKDMSAPPEKKENIRLCEDCKEKEPISLKHSLCASCMAIRSHKKRPPNKKTPASPKRKGNLQRQGKHKSEIVDSERNMEVVFSKKYNQVLEKIKKLAEEEIRTVDAQIIYMLKKYLDNIKVNKRP